MLTSHSCINLDGFAFGWWTIFDTHRKLLNVKNPAVLQFLTQSMSHLSQGLKTLYPVLSPSSKLIQVDLTGDINKGS
jgi:hypothetical protein